jgi:hypothetical protein
MASSREVRETQIDSVAGIWFCNRCGRRIQVITESDYPKRQSFTCVCGAVMQPGPQHAHREGRGARVVDD